MNNKITKEAALKIAAPYSLGYTKNSTVENLLKEVGQRICTHHGWQFNESEALDAMSDQNVIKSGGLDNFVYTYYTRLQLKNLKKNK